MTLSRMESPCVTTTCADEWLEGLHFDTAEEALAAMADTYVQAGLVPLGAPCWTVVCDGCGEDLEDDEVCLHLPSAADAETVAREVGGWTSPDGRLWFCRDCPVGETPPSTVGRFTAVMDGQGTLL
ncbi:MAG: hypothetical protein QOD49_1540 [Actinomycetota bacterium]|nr:hypothetical protein [Actinomycetota bacterium]